jgi:hypothetical protein
VEKTLAEQHLDNLASGKTSKTHREQVNLAKRGGGEEVEIDKSRLKKALDEERKRKGMGDDEAWQQTKKGKTDVTQEELGEFPYTCSISSRLTSNRGISVVEAGLQRSNGQLQGSRGRLTIRVSCLHHVVVRYYQLYTMPIRDASPSIP